jgi:hypothetical protein
MHFNSGADIPTKTNELLHHFQQMGSPIMIGGGVLAYTLLGVEYSPKTQQTKYLILDPHFLGKTDDLQAIKQKGWCSWKPASLFRKDSFYNFCLPIV